MKNARRPRRLRQSESIRSLVCETILQPQSLIAPFFVTHGRGLRRLISALPGHAQLSIDELIVDVERAHRLGIQSVLLFGLPKKKDPQH
jgi:porphobilinogen synthase